MLTLLPLSLSLVALCGSIYAVSVARRMLARSLSRQLFVLSESLKEHEQDLDTMRKSLSRLNSRQNMRELRDQRRTEAAEPATTDTEESRAAARRALNRSLAKGNGT